MIPALRLLIVSGPYEGERIRRAAALLGLDGQVIEATDLADFRNGDAVLVAINRADVAPRATLERLRARVGDEIPLFALGEPQTASAAAGVVNAFFSRSLGADMLVERLRDELARAPVLGQGSRTQANGAEIGPGPDARRPLAGAQRPTSGRTSLLDDLGASIDTALERDLFEAAGLAMAGPSTGIAPADAFDGRNAHATREAPAELMETILASAGADDVRTVSQVRPVLPPRGAPAGPRKPAPAPESEGDVDLPALLGQAFTEAFTGRLRLRQGETEKNIFFEIGRPVLASSNAVEDRMIEIFLRQGRITAEQHQEAVRVAGQTGRRMGALLIELGIMRSDELLPAVREHYEEIIFSLFSWPRATVRREVGSVADPRRVRLLRHPVALVHEGVKRIYSHDRLIAQVDASRRVFRLDARPGVSEILDELNLDASTRRAAHLFDGSRAFDQVSRTAGADEGALQRLVIVLLAFGALESAAAGSAPRVPAATRERDDRIDRERLLARHQVVREGDYFQVLGVSQEAEPAEIAHAYSRLMLESEPASLSSSVASDLADPIRELREVAGEALRVLTSPTQRDAYRAALCGAGAGAAPPAVGPAANQAADNQAAS